MKDFINFGRTVVYFINDKYVIDYGIITGVLDLGAEIIPESINGIPVITYQPPIDIYYPDDMDNVSYFIKHKISDNQYEYINILRKYFYFEVTDAIKTLIIFLKQYILNDNNFTYELLYDNFIKGYLYLYKQNSNIFEDEDIINNNFIEDESIHTQLNVNKINFNVSDIYKLVCKLNDVIYDTNINNANIYNGLLDNIQLNFDNMTEISIPEDYYKYSLNVINLPIDQEYNIQLILSEFNEPVAKSEYTKINSDNIIFNRFIPYNYNNNSLSYYKFDGSYSLLVNLYDNDNNLIKSLKFVGNITDFNEDIIDYNLLEEINEL